MRALNDLPSKENILKIFHDVEVVLCSQVIEMKVRFHI